MQHVDGPTHGRPLGRDAGPADADPALEDWDDELAAEAIAADPDAPLGADAVPLPEGRLPPDPLLPAWYMPPPATNLPARRRWLVAVAVVLVATLLALNAAGLGVTYGHVR